MKTTTNHDFAIGKKIKLIRKKHHLTQTQVAIAMRTSQGAVSQMERGDVPVSHRLIAAVSSLTGIKPLDIDPFFNHPFRFGKRKMDFAKSDHIYVCYNQTIKWSKVGISNSPLTRSKAHSNQTSLPGHFELEREWDVGSNAKIFEKETLSYLAGKGYNVDRELIECTPQTVIDAVQSLIDSDKIQS